MISITHRADILLQRSKPNGPCPIAVSKQSRGRACREGLARTLNFVYWASRTISAIRAAARGVAKTIILSKEVVMHMFLLCVLATNVHSY